MVFFFCENMYMYFLSIINKFGTPLTHLTFVWLCRSKMSVNFIFFFFFFARYLILVFFSWNVQDKMFTNVDAQYHKALSIHTNNYVSVPKKEMWKFLAIKKFSTLDYITDSSIAFHKSNLLWYFYVNYTHIFILLIGPLLPPFLG